MYDTNDLFFQFAFLASKFYGRTNHRDRSMTWFNNFDAEMCVHAKIPPLEKCTIKNPDTKGWSRIGKMGTNMDV